MNYDAATARLHGVDYRGIAAAGLDYLVFQAYDYAWRQHFGLTNKDTLTNLSNLDSVQTEICSVTEASTKVLVTAETADSIEGWVCPLQCTLEQLRAYSCGKQDSNREIAEGEVHHVKAAGKPIPDGIFLVWINETPRGNIGSVRTEFEDARIG
jgi:hypothetical protein